MHITNTIKASMVNKLIKRIKSKHSYNNCQNINSQSKNSYNSKNDGKKIITKGPLEERSLSSSGRALMKIPI